MKISQKDRELILEMHVKKGYKTINNEPNTFELLKEQSREAKIIEIQNKLILKGFLKSSDAKGKFDNKTKQAVINFQSKNGLKPDGLVGPCTAEKLGTRPLYGSGPCKTSVKTKITQDKDTTKKVTDNKTKVTGSKYDCIAVSPEQCAKISSTSETSIGSGEEKQCTAYARKCLSEYGINSLGGSAWEALKFLKGRGAKEKYNMFTGLNYDNLEKNIKKLGLNTEKCKCFDEKIGVDINVDIECDKGKLAKEITNFYPSKSGVDLSSLELGDIVGIYWNNSGNKGKAFCEKASVDDEGNINNKNTAINTHLGFVGAIKNGVPIIFHNVHQQYLATPANKYINKPSGGAEGGMITWVVTDPDLKHKIGVEKGTEEETFFEKIKGGFKDYFKS